MKKLLLIGMILSACLHHPGVSSCPTEGKESFCWESKRYDENNEIRHKVVERITEGQRCDLVVVEQSSYDELGRLFYRVIDEKECRVINKRVIEELDRENNTITLTVLIDSDHNDSFDRKKTSEVSIK